MHEIVDQLMGHAAAVWRHRWYVIITAWVVSVIGWIAVFNIPDRYQASARVYVDSQSLLKPLLAGIAVQPNINEQVSILANTLLSRPNLEKVARMTDQDLQAKNPAQLESIVNGMEKGITLKGAGYGDMYTISYENRNPELAKKVVQSLLTIFVESGLGNNRKNITSSQKFIDDQVKDYEAKLIESENALKQFKQQNIGILPGEIGQDYYTELASTQEKMNQAEMALREAENRRDSLKRQISGEDPSLVMDTTTGSNPEIDARIQSLKQNLDSLRLKYTDQYPDIVAAKRLIAELEETKKKEASIRKPSSGLAQNSFYQQLNVSLAEATAEVSSLQARMNEYQRQYGRLRAQAGRIPEVEAQYTQLTRNYDIYKKNYEALLARGESAKLSGELQSKTDVADFRVVDPPRVPLSPSFPNRPLLMSLVMLGGLGVGVALAFLVSQIRPTVNNQSDLHALTKLPLLGSVTMIETPELIATKRKGLIRYAIASGALLITYGALVGFHFVANMVTA